VSKGAKASSTLKALVARNPAPPAVEAAAPPRREGADAVPGAEPGGARRGHPARAGRRAELVRATEAQHARHRGRQLFMAPGDIGRVIGRQGRTAQAVRGLVSLAAEKTGGKAQVEFREQR
jgi:predicted RNA-binding protein YlqC (UPF0109 family)